MTAHNRYLRGPQDAILAQVRGNTVVEAGDFMVRNGTAGVISEAGAAGDGLAVDAYVYPFNDVENGSSSQATILAYLAQNFIGVAMESSQSGDTEQITVNTNGVYQYEMVGGPGGVTVGDLVSATSPATGTPPSVQMVARSNSSPGTTAYLGRIVKTESGASFVQFQIGTLYNSFAT